VGRAGGGAAGTRLVGKKTWKKIAFFLKILEYGLF
jgi:hypothetical protein